MKLAPLTSLWLIVPYLSLAVAVIVWQFFRIRSKKHRRWLLLLLPGLIALGPSVPGGTSSPGVGNLDVIMAVDTTPSMGALDYAGSKQRLDGVKQDLAALGNQLPGAHLELITFDSEASVAMPFTTYATAFDEAVQSMTPQITGYSQGSAVDQPIDLITQELKNSRAAYPDRQRLLFYFGDGEQTVGAAVRTFEPIAPLINGGAVLGYGTAVGAKMLAYTDPGSGSPSSSYIQTVNPTTRSLGPAISQMDAATLQTIAGQLRVPYQDRDQGGAISGVYQASKAPELIDKSQHITRYLNMYWLLSIPLTVLLFFEWQSLVTKLLELRAHRKEVHD